MSRISATLIYFIFLVIIVGCSPESPPESFLDQVDQIRDKWAPDKRIRLFNIEYKYENSEWHVTGETSVREIQIALSEALKQHPEMQDAILDFNLLPDASFGDTTMALVGVSVANLRRHPGHSSELVDQVLMGMPLKLLKRKSYWILVQTPSEYLGWVTRGSIDRKDSAAMSAWQLSNKSEVTVNYCQIYEKPSEVSQVVSDLVLGCVVQSEEMKGNWTKVTLPDERTGFVRKNNLRVYQIPDNSGEIDRDALIAKAKTMLGLPYLWGGNSVKGFDCSGFTGTVFQYFGYELPRDANMQVKLGEEIVPDEDYSNVLAGDLIFFGSEKKITHVGICMGGSYFIHSSGLVKINSLDENDELFNPYRKRTFRHIKRIINN